VQILKPFFCMKFILRQISGAALCLGLMLCIAPAFAQVKTPPSSSRFNKELADANLNFTLPNGFREIRPADSEDFDYAIEIQDGDFEIWFQTKSLKENKPIKLKNDKQVNPDSLYVEMGRAQAQTFMGNNNYLARNIPPRTLASYNADAGKTYLLNLPDAAATKHYKYAMVVVLQKNHAGTLEAVCFANELGAGFFKNLSIAQSCIKFNP